MLTYVDNLDPMTQIDRPFLALLSESTWFQAEAEAAVFGGHLVSVGDQSVNDRVNTQFSNFGGQRALWLGLNDLNSEGTFQWTDGTDVGYTNWFRSEPNNFGGIEHSVLMLPNGQWNDADGREAIAFGVAVVSRVPEPRHVWVLGSVVALWLIPTGSRLIRRRRNVPASET